MYSLLVLGLIPGTNIQINFWAWIGLMTVLLILFRIYGRRVMNFVVAWWRSLDYIDDPRDPLHASQLHSRLHLTAR